MMNQDPRAQSKWNKIDLLFTQVEEQRVHPCSLFEGKMSHSFAVAFEHKMPAVTAVVFSHPKSCTYPTAANQYWYQVHAAAADCAAAFA